jgi:hypothetical protein
MMARGFDQPRGGFARECGQANGMIYFIGCNAGPAQFYNGEARRGYQWIDLPILHARRG